MAAREPTTGAVDYVTPHQSTLALSEPHQSHLARPQANQIIYTIRDPNNMSSDVRIQGSPIYLYPNWECTLILHGLLNFGSQSHTHVLGYFQSQPSPLHAVGHIHINNIG